MHDDTEKRDRQPGCSLSGHPQTEERWLSSAGAEGVSPEDVRDPFSDYLRQRLENHRLPLDDASWEMMEARMQAKRPAARTSFSLRRTVWWMAAAVLAAFVLLVPFLQKERRSLTADKRMSPSEQPALSPEQPLPSKASPDTTALPFASDAPGNATDRAVMAKKRPPIAPQYTDRIQENAILSEARHPLSVDKDTLSSLSAEPVVQPDDSLPVADKPERVTKEALADAGPDEGKPSPSVASPSLDDRTQAVKRSLAGKGKDVRQSRSYTASSRSASGGWLLAARVGTEGYASLPETSYLEFDSPNDPPSGYPTPGDPSGDPSGQPPVNPEPQPPTPPLDLSPEDFPDADYLPPLSFGLTVRKRLTSRIGIETGLVYTYLASRFVRSDVPRVEARQELHYLGVPLNVVVDLYNRSRWELYIMGGGMAEKGLRSVYSVTGYQLYDIVSRTERKRVNGLQWSLNASVGVSYRFYRSWSFYLEPRFSYYFDTNQPASIRTDKPLGFGLGGGIRYAF